MDQDEFGRGSCEVVPRGQVDVRQVKECRLLHLNWVRGLHNLRTVQPRSQNCGKARVQFCEYSEGASLVVVPQRGTMRTEAVLTGNAPKSISPLSCCRSEEQGIV